MGSASFSAKRNAVMTRGKQPHMCRFARGDWRRRDYRRRYVTRDLTEFTRNTYFANAFHFLLFDRQLRQLRRAERAFEVTVSEQEA